MADKQTTAVMDQAVKAMADLGGKYLTFKLEAEEYGLEILKVREIIGVMDITAVPQTPAFVRGVINLRGKIIPVVNLRAKFGMEAIDDTEDTCIIVVDVNKDEMTINMGILVDSVSEVLDITEEDIEETPSFGASVNTDFILGMAKAKGKVKILLNIQKVMTESELAAVTASAGSSTTTEKIQAKSKKAKTEPKAEEK